MQKDERGVMMSDPTPGSGRHSATMTPTTAEDPSQRPSGAGRVAWLLLLAGACALAAAIYSGIHSRVAAETNLKQATEEASVATVNVVHPKSDAPTQEIVLPGNTQAFIEAPIYARTNGYLKRWYFDIGAQVKKGELLAEIETPEVDQQLEQARSDLETAKANLELSKTTAARYRALIQSRSVSQQDTDAAVSDLNAKLSMVNSNASNVRRLEEMQSFEKVYAPFDGVVTARNTDIGSLIDAGAATPGKELFHMTEISKLRVKLAEPGMTRSADLLHDRIRLSPQLGELLRARRLSLRARRRKLALDLRHLRVERVQPLVHRIHAASQFFGCGWLAPD